MSGRLQNVKHPTEDFPRTVLVQSYARVHPAPDRHLLEEDGAVCWTISSSARCIRPRCVWSFFDFGLCCSAGYSSVQSFKPL